MATVGTGKKVDHIYVMGPEIGPQKIGITNDLLRRLTSVQTGSPVPYVISSSIPLPKGAAREVEALAHFTLKERHVRGEWFNVTRDEAREVLIKSVEHYRGGTRTKDLIADSHRPPSRRGRRCVSLWVTEDRKEILEEICRENGLTTQEAGVMAIRDLFAKYGMPIPRMI